MTCDHRDIHHIVLWISSIYIGFVQEHLHVQPFMSLYITGSKSSHTCRLFCKASRASSLSESESEEVLKGEGFRLLLSRAPKP